MGESTARQSAYGFIRPLLGHFWFLALWDELNVELGFYYKVTGF